MSITKYNGVAWCDIASIMGANATDLAKASGTDRGSCGPTIAVVSSQKNWVMISQTAGFASGTWSSYQSNGRTADTQRSIDYGLMKDGTPTWMIVNNKTARPIRLAQVTPTGSSDWTEVNPTGEAGYDVTHGIDGTFILVGNDGEYATFQDNDGETITTGGDWNGRRPINGDLSTSNFLTAVGFNHNADNPLYIAVTNNGRCFSSTDGGDGDAADWTTRYGTVGTSGANNGTNKALWDIAFGNDLWVAAGYYGHFEHITGSADGTTWGILNKPAGASAGAMYGVDGDANGNWVMAGASGYVWHSTDNAVTWTENQVANAGGSNGTWQAVKYDGAGTWWLVGGAGYLAKSTDMTSWTQIDTPVTDTGGATSYQIAFNSVRTS